MLFLHSPLPFHPATFLEHGAKVPFTTPMLAGTRARPMAGGGTELMVPNPSGRRGAYVLPWNALRGLCRPSLHDDELSARVFRLDMVTPETIRLVAREVAIEELGERISRVVAASEMARGRTDPKLTNFLLLLALVRQMEPPGGQAVPLEQDQPAELIRRALAAITRLASQLDCAPGKIVSGLEQLAGLLASTGIGPQAAQARHTRGMENLHRLREDTWIWSQDSEDEHAATAGLVASIADRTLAAAGTAIAAARGLSRDMITLLRSWRATPASISERATRPDWLLDDWEPICRIWGAAETDVARRDALRRIARMVPVIPRAFATSVGRAFSVDEIPAYRQGVRRNQDWRTGLTVLTAVARDPNAGLIAELEAVDALAREVLRHLAEG